MLKIVPKKLDIKRLLDAMCKVEVNIDPERGEGKTLALFYLMLTEIIHHDHNTYHAYISHNMMAAALGARDFGDFLTDHHEEFVAEGHTRIIIPETKQTFQFLSRDQFIDPVFIQGRRIKKAFNDAAQHHLTGQQWKHWLYAVLLLQSQGGKLIG